MMISIIIPTYNEQTCIENTLRNIQRLQHEAAFEIIVSDGGSHDATVSIARKYARVVRSEKGKATQLNAAARIARGDILFFVHADMLLPSHTLRLIVQKVNFEDYDGGGFSNKFSSHTRKIKVLGRILNMRVFDNDHSRNTAFFGDNGIFVKKNVFEALGGFKPIPIMEDYDFSRRMKERFKVIRIQEPRLVLSPRRHLKSGFVKTRLQWIIIKRLYLIGVSPDRLVKWYRDVR